MEHCHTYVDPGSRSQVNKMCQLRKLLLVIIFVQMVVTSTEQTSRVVQFQSPLVVDYKYIIEAIQSQKKAWWKRGTQLHQQIGELVFA
ncbi:hypothetical protein PPYR_09167 [Photinus pyralis]|uniref:Uncharacterized protein n=1 Tax=Photinus pyralis TaxID=7054 RepID=A0A5N4ALI6_PHOPY|nr:hypothetical protein PPYR_09167 [Photinus pyralis]